MTKMKTDIVTVESDSDREAIQRAGRLLRDGAIVAIPTETVYGLAAKAENRILSRLDRIKVRAAGKRYTLHIGRIEDLSRYVPRPSLQGRKLMRNTWPGPVTIVFELDETSLKQVKHALPADTFELLYPDGTLGVRCPDNPVTSAVLTEALAPVVAPSANPDAQRPALTAQEVVDYFDGHIEMVIDTPGANRHRLASTVVRTGQRGLEVLREGVYSRQQILEAAAVTILFVCTGNTCRSPMAEALCRKYFANKLNCGLDQIQDRGYTVASAGVAAFDGMPASSHALDVCREKQTPLASHRSTTLTESMIRQADLIFGMTAGHVQAVVDAVPQAGDRCFLLDPAGEISDPVGLDIDTYRACAEQIERCLSERINELL